MRLFLAHNLKVPLPDFGGNGLTDGAEHSQMPHGTLDVFIASALQQSEGSGSHVKLSDLVLLDNLPVSREVGVGWRTLKHNGGHAEQQRSIYDIGVAGNPTNVTTAEVTVAVVDVKDMLAGQGGAQQVAGCGVHDALGLAGRARSIKQEERILRVHDLGGNVAGPLLELLVPPDIASLLHGDVGAGALEDEDVGDIGALLERVVDNLLGADELATTLPLICRDDDAGAGINDTISQGVGREASKDYGVNSTNTDTGENGDDSLGNHGQIDGDCVPLANTHLLQSPCCLGDLAQQLAVGDISAILGLIGLVDDGDAVRILEGMAIDQVVAGVELALDEPLDIAVGQGAAADGVKVAVP